MNDNFWDDCKEKVNNSIQKKAKIENKKSIAKISNSSFDLGSIAITTNNNTNKNIKHQSISSGNIFKDVNNESKIRNYKRKQNQSVNSLKNNNLKDLKECTFQPKILHLKNKEIKNKIYKYIQKPYYERFKLFMLKQKDFELKSSLQKEFSKTKYSFKPEIHRCLNFNNIIKNQRNEDLNDSYYKRMEFARFQRKLKLKDENTKNNYYGENLKLKNFNDCKTSNKNNSLKIKKSLSQKDALLYFKYLHSELMTMNSINENDKNGIINEDEIKRKIFISYNPRF